MEINLLLTAKPLMLAGYLMQTEVHGGVIVVKNVAERTYLTVTPKQWRLLSRFQEPQTVPHMLEKIIEQRVCPPLGEYYELVLKAVRARILVESEAPGIRVAASWMVSLRPEKLRHVLWVLLAAGLGLSAAWHPVLPRSAATLAGGIGVMLAALWCGQALAASLLRGAGGEVYLRRGFFICTDDAGMLPPSEQTVVRLAPVALMGAVTGLLTWHWPEWSFFPLLGLLGLLRPVLGGSINHILRAHADPRLSDADHDFIFPLNRTPRRRWRMLWQGLRRSETWKEIGYGIVWTMAAGFFFGVLTDVSPWTAAFWTSRVPRLALALVGSLVLLATAYLVYEFYLLARDRAIARHETLRLWFNRWFRRGRVRTTPEARARAVLRSPVLRQLPPPDQNALVSAFQPFRAGAWRQLHPACAQPDRVSLILSGRVGVYRQLKTGRRVLVQVLCEDELVGLHGAADPRQPEYLYRTLTPVVLLQLDWAQAEKLILAKVAPAALANLVLKLPFLSRIGLCQNWHIQAVQRFAELATLKDYQNGESILQEGLFNDNFFVLFEGEAVTTRRGTKLGRVRAGHFFGEIGLLQNSTPTAQITAQGGARCLCIRRREFLRFVTHNYSVAIELERVSSDRLGHPIFPLTPGAFQIA